MMVRVPVRLLRTSPGPLKQSVPLAIRAIQVQRRNRKVRAAIGPLLGAAQSECCLVPGRSDRRQV